MTMILLQASIVLLILLLQPMPSWSQCPNGFVMTKSKTACYAAFYADQGREHAKRLCAAQYGSVLPMFKDKTDIKEMNDAIRVPYEFWYGANATGIAGGVVQGKSDFVLDDPGDCLFWAPWGAGQPKLTLQKCTVFWRSSNEVHNYFCSATLIKRPVICQLRLPAFGCGVHKISTAGRLCPIGFVPTKNKTACYRNFDNHLLTFRMKHHEARKLCASYSGSVLPMFRNHKDVDDMMEAIHIPDRIHLGANAIKVIKVYEMDNPADPCKLVPMIPWAKYEPSLDTERCPSLFDHDRLVYDWPCGTPFGVVCQFRLPNFGCGVHKLTDANSDCPDGFAQTETKTACYLTIPYPQTRFQARQICNAHSGSKVAIFKDESDVYDMKRVIFVPNIYHVGINSIEKKDVWVKEEPDSCDIYKPWVGVPPTSKILRCATMDKTSDKLTAYMCSDKISVKVVCQIKLEKYGCGVGKAQKQIPSSGSSGNVPAAPSVAPGRGVEKVPKQIPSSGSGGNVPAAPSVAPGRGAGPVPKQIPSSGSSANARPKPFVAPGRGEDKGKDKKVPKEYIMEITVNVTGTATKASHNRNAFGPGLWNDFRQYLNKHGLTTGVGLKNERRLSYAGSKVRFTAHIFKKINWNVHNMDLFGKTVENRVLKYINANGVESIKGNVRWRYVEKDKVV